MLQSIRKSADDRMKKREVLAASLVASWFGVDPSELLSVSDRGQAVGGAKQAIALIIALTVGAIVASILLPVGLDEIVGVNTSNYSDGAQSMWDILDVVIVLALLLFFIAVALAAADRV